MLTPSLRALQAFEVAARTGSFVSAAAELSVTAAAVSQLIRGLEGQVDRKLFHRVNRRVILTEAGHEILPRLSAAFEELRGVSRHLSGTGPRPRLVISVPQSVATGWLARLIADFATLHGAFDISVRGEEDPVAFDRDLIDLRFSFGLVHYDEQEGVEIITDGVFPLCSPAFANEYGPFDTPERLTKAPLVHTDWGPASTTFPLWRGWFEEMGFAPGPNADRGMIANSSQVALELAVSGLGMVLSQGLLAARWVEEGALVSANPHYLLLSQPYVLTIPARAAQRPVVQVFASWLRQQALRSVRTLLPAAS